MTWVKNNWLALVVLMLVGISSLFLYWGLRNVSARVDTRAGSGTVPLSDGKLASVEHVREGNKKVADEAYGRGLEKAGVRVLTREEVLKLADEAIEALLK